MIEMEIAKKGESHSQYWKLAEFSNVPTKLDTRRGKPFESKPEEVRSRVQSSVASK